LQNALEVWRLNTQSCLRRANVVHESDIAGIIDELLAFACDGLAQEATWRRRLARLRATERNEAYF
jgi:hypothetical protein